MRTVIDIMIGAMLVAAVAGGLYLYNSQAKGERDTEAVRTALQQLREQATYHTAVQSAMAGRDTLLVHMHAEWFGENVPVNALLTPDHPWIDLAPPGDLGEHPPDPVATRKDQAGFWYNPTTGVFRARARPRSSEAQTLALYNEINGTALPAFEQIPDPSRNPVAHIPGTTPARLYATMANKTWSEAPPEDTLLDQPILAPPTDAQASPTAAAAPQQSPGTNKDVTDSPSGGHLTRGTETIVEVVSDPIKRPTLKNESREAE